MLCAEMDGRGGEGSARLQEGVVIWRSSPDQYASSVDVRGELRECAAAVWLALDPPQCNPPPRCRGAVGGCGLKRVVSKSQRKQYGPQQVPDLIGLASCDGGREGRMPKC